MARSSRIQFARHTERKVVPYLLRAQAQHLAHVRAHRVGLAWDGISWSLSEDLAPGDVRVGSDGREHLVGRDDFITWEA